MEITLNTPALLFPAITLLLLAYTNRFLAIASLIRKLHDEYVSGKKEKHMLQQLHNLRQRIRYIRLMQALGVLSFLGCVVCMYSIYKGWSGIPEFSFAFSLLSLLVSLLLSFLEITLSTKALELVLSDIEELERTGFFSGFRSAPDEKKE
jgi:hypothetical protein